MKKIFLSLLMFVFASLSHANTIEFVVTTAAGGPNDNLSRLLVKELEMKTDLKFVVVNKPGAAHNIGYAYVNETNKPTVFVSTDTIITNKNRDGYPEGVADKVEPLILLGNFTNIVFVNSKSNIHNIDDLIELSKTRDIKFGHGGIGTYSHKTSTLLCEKIISCLQVPYKSGSSAMMDMLSNSIDAYSLTSYGSESFIENPNFRPIMMFSNTKHPTLNVNTLPFRYRDLETKEWIILFSKNLTPDQKKKITDTISAQPDRFFTNFGVWYKKNEQIKWNK